MKFAHTLRNYDKKNLGKDILAGLIIMAVSIPISMGYAQIAGLLQYTDYMDPSFNFDLCTVFYITAVYLWGGCGSGGTDWIGVGRIEYHSRFDRSTGGSS
ncbi:MAG: hypothetical protein ACLUD0_05930 [Eubacterium ramulus]